MILSDTGPLVAVLDKGDSHHSRCVQALSTLQVPLITTWPCFTEAMHLLYRAGGYPAQEALWGLRRTNILRLHSLTETEANRVELLMRQYRDRPMDVAEYSFSASSTSRMQRSSFVRPSDYNRAGGAH